MVHSYAASPESPLLATEGPLMFSGYYMLSLVELKVQTQSIEIIGNTVGIFSLLKEQIVDLMERGRSEGFTKVNYILNGHQNCDAGES